MNNKWDNHEQWEISEQMNIEEITANQPFCAGVIAFLSGKLIVTLNTDGVPEGSNNMLRIGAVGGGQEPGETILECAKREAQEELSVKQITLEHAPVTYFHDMDTNELRRVQALDAAAPFLFQRLNNPRPDTPYKPGLPTGRYIYFSLYFAALHEEAILPGDDVAALLLVPLEKWFVLEQSCSLGEAIAQGLEIITTAEKKSLFSQTTSLYLPENESLLTAVPLLKETLSEAGFSFSNS